MYSTRDSEKITKALLGPRSRPIPTTRRLYPNSVNSSMYSKLYNNTKLPSDVGSSGPVTPCVDQDLSLTEMETILLKSSRGVTFAKIAKRNPQGWQKIVKAQLEHEKFLNTMHFYDTTFLHTMRSNEENDIGEGLFYNPELGHLNKARPGKYLKSFQIPWKSALKSEFVSPTEQRRIAFHSLKNVSMEPPQTPPVIKSKENSIGESITDKEKFGNKNRKTDSKKEGRNEARKPYATLKPLPLRMKPLSINYNRTEKPSLNEATPSIIFRPPHQMDSFHNQLKSGLLSRARRVEMESHTDLSASNSMRSPFSLISHKSQSYYNLQEQSSNSQEPHNSSNSQQSSNSLKSHISSNVPSYLQKSQTSSEASSSKDAHYLRNRLLKEAVTNIPENTLQEKLENSSSSFSNVSMELKKPRMFQHSSILPVFIQSPYTKRAITPNSDEREYIKELRRKLEEEQQETEDDDKIFPDN